MYLIASFTVLNLKRKFRVDLELWGHTIFRPKMAHLPQWEFFRKNLTFIYLMAHFIAQSFKKLKRDPKLWGCAIFRPKLAYLPQQRTFSENSVNLLCWFISINMQKITFRCQFINEILTIKEYWDLIGWEHFWP